MDRDTAYSILYKDGYCNKSPEIIEILDSIIKEICANTGTSYPPINSIDRWNIYNPSSIHIVYTTQSHLQRGIVVDGKALVDGRELICSISDFASKYRDYQLSKIGI